jgi:hypothetical protein
MDNSQQKFPKKIVAMLTFAVIISILSMVNAQTSTQHATVLEVYDALGIKVATAQTVQEVVFDFNPSRIISGTFPYGGPVCSTIGLGWSCSNSLPQYQYYNANYPQWAQAKWHITIRSPLSYIEGDLYNRVRLWTSNSKYSYDDGWFNGIVGPSRGGSTSCDISINLNFALIRLTIP